MKRRYLVVLAVVILVVLASVRPALADAAPPAPPPGSAVGSGDPATHVQMVSESVLMVITDYDGPPFGSFGSSALATNMMVGHVQADFQMMNQGTDTETLDVRFPLGAPDGYTSVETVDNFTAFVDGQAAETQTIEQVGEWDKMVPWATWEATFAPGQTVNLSVAYDVHPEGYAPWGTFTYILETGAGWYGPIGEGTVTFRLPYEVNDLNTTKIRDGSIGPDTISGTDVIWHFSNLEPTASNNAKFTVLPPAVWVRIEQAQASVDANPDSGDAQFELARALHSTLSFKYGLVDIGSSATFAEQAKEAYKRALELEPDNVDIYAEYLDLLIATTIFNEPYPEEVVPLLEKALQLAPQDERLLERKNQVTSSDFHPNPYLTVTLPATADAVEPTLAPTTVVLIVTVTPMPTVTPTPTATSVPPSDLSFGPITCVCGAIGAVVIAIGGALVGVWVYRRKTRGA